MGERLVMPWQRGENTSACKVVLRQMVADWHDAVLYGDGSMPTWVKHRIDPLDPRWWPPGQRTDG